MGCCHYYAPSDGGDAAFSIDAAAITFGAGSLSEIGDRTSNRGLQRVALFFDKHLKELEHIAIVKQSLLEAKIDVVVYDEVEIEPTDKSFLAAATFAKEAKVDGFISVGGGSVMDTCKAANLYSTYPADFLTYVNGPIGDGKPVPGPLKPHIACPTTCGTGSECTGIAIFDFLEIQAKTGIASKHLRPSEAVIDPTTTHTLPVNVLASSAFDVLCHALESYTSMPHTKRKKPERPSLRPMGQGANPWSDIGCREALRIIGKNMMRAVDDASDHEARHQMMWAATLAGIAFGNSGCHVPHGMSYAVAGLVQDFFPEGYPHDHAMVPHGMSVIVNAPSAFRFLAPACPDRHLEAAGWLGADLRGAGEEDAGEVVSKIIISLMKKTKMPNGLNEIGYTKEDIPALTEGSFPQKRLLNNAPREISKEVLSTLFQDAIAYW